MSKNIKSTGGDTRHPQANPHLVRHPDGTMDFQSDKYPSCPVGKVPLSTKDPMAQDLLAEYAHRRRSVDEELADAVETALRHRGFDSELAFCVTLNTQELSILGLVITQYLEDYTWESEHSLIEELLSKLSKIG